jgi:hypothetical protein
MANGVINVPAIAANTRAQNTAAVRQLGGSIRNLGDVRRQAEERRIDLGFREQAEDRADVQLGLNKQTVGSNLRTAQLQQANTQAEQDAMAALGGGIHPSKLSPLARGKYTVAKQQQRQNEFNQAKERALFIADMYDKVGVSLEPKDGAETINSFIDEIGILFPRDATIQSFRVKPEDITDPKAARKAMNDMVAISNSNMSPSDKRKTLKSKVEAFPKLFGEKEQKTIFGSIEAQEKLAVQRMKAEALTKEKTFAPGALERDYNFLVKTPPDKLAAALKLLAKVSGADVTDGEIDERVEELNASKQPGIQSQKNFFDKLGDTLKKIDPAQNLTPLLQLLGERSGGGNIQPPQGSVPPASDFLPTRE